MNIQPKLTIQSLLFVTGLAALSFAWWSDHRYLNQQWAEDRLELQRVTRDSLQLRRSCQSAERKVDALFLETLEQKDTISELRQAITAMKLATDG